MPSREEEDEAKPLLPGKAQPESMDYSPMAAFSIFFFPALGGLLFGYDIGATSAVLTQLESSSYSGVTWYSTVADSSLYQGLITSMGMLGAMVGSMICFAIADDLGRRRSIILASILFLLGAGVEYISGRSNFTSTQGIGILITGRIIYGIGCGFAMHGAPAYIGEMAPPAIRGRLVSLKEAFIVVGMVLGYSIGYAYSTVEGGWRKVYLWSASIAVIMFFGMYHLPYSARWLALKGRINEARASMKFVIPNLPESEMESIRESADKASKTQSDKSWSADYQRLSSPSVWPALIAGVGLVVLQQITGQPSVLYYADSLFEDIGLSTVASIAVSMFKLVATLIATFTVDNYGRKKLLFIGCGLMLFALLMLGTAFVFPYTSTSECNAYTEESTCPSDCSWSSSCDTECTDDADCTCCGSGGMDTQRGFILTALFIYIGGYQVGFGPISWLMISEIFPLEVRGKAVSIAVVSNFFWNTVMTFAFAVEIDYFGTAATFYLYALILVFGIYFIYKRVPETKGLSLEEIEEYFIRTSRLGVKSSTSMPIESHDATSKSNSVLVPAI
jgi:sugar porter (SP) family MFS transporter